MSARAGNGAEQSSFGVADGQDRQARVIGALVCIFAIRAERDAVGFGLSSNVMQRASYPAPQADRVWLRRQAGDRLRQARKHARLVETLANQPRTSLAGALSVSGPKARRSRITPHGLAVRSPLEAGGLASGIRDIASWLLMM